MIIEEAHRLNQVIKESAEYTEYRNALEKIRQNQELYQAMNSFRKRNFELQSYEDGRNRYDEIFNLSREYSAVLSHPLVNSFLVSEQVLTRTMAEVYEIMVKELELDYDYMM